MHNHLEMKPGLAVHPPSLEDSSQYKNLRTGGLA